MKTTGKQILKMCYGAVLIVLAYIIVGKLMLFIYNPPKLVDADTVGQELSDIVRLRVQTKETYFPYPVDENDAINFTGLLRYNSQVYIGTGYIAYQNSNYPWYVILKRIPLTNYYVCLPETNYVYSHLSSIGDKETLRLARTEVWYFTNLNIYVSPDTAQLKGEIQLDFPRIIICLGVLIGFFYGSWARYKKKRLSSSHEIEMVPPKDN